MRAVASAPAPPGECLEAEARQISQNVRASLSLQGAALAHSRNNCCSSRASVSKLVPQPHTERSAVEDARQFLAGLLADGPVNAGQIKKDADGAGFNWRTVQRAADRLGVVRHKEGMRGGWVWNLAPKMTNNTEGDTQKAMAPSGSVVAFGGDSEPVEVDV